ncbi:CubicO group peptidase, beta-lactamase class C family [Geodermatophilus obscurus]|uniref:CubicO group peptidase, beta-lactamase class C family n=1 Tax=Geodermatophilus obscurus TaxID=1861 RepID=A0A1I5H2N9_9ACTN|nr:CubicO group peptidase, beta-lactamase class C family [Geodermatophilus obscurus]
MLAVCERIDREIRTRPDFAHTSHLRVDVGGEVVFDHHYRGPAVADVFSVTKSVLAAVAGIAARDGHLRDLDLPVGPVLDLPLPGQTVRHLLTMTRGCETGGPYDIDEVCALPSGWLERIAAAPALEPPGTRFRYDNGAAHLLAAVLDRLLPGGLASFAERELFGPLGITGWRWHRDPDGVPTGHAHLELDAAGLAALGRLWLSGTLLDPGFARDMLTAHTRGGPPEERPYGYLVWIDDAGPLAGGWAGQHVHAVPAADAVVVTTGDPEFSFGPPPRDRLQDGWRPAHDLVAEHLLPVLVGG